jgi:hypothetical protein
VLDYAGHCSHLLGKELTKPLPPPPYEPTRERLPKTIQVYLKRGPLYPKMGMTCPYHLKKKKREN